MLLLAATVTVISYGIPLKFLILENMNYIVCLMIIIY